MGVNRMGVNLEGEANLLGLLCSFEYTQMLRLGYHLKRGYFTFIVASLLVLAEALFFEWAPESFITQV